MSKLKVGVVGCGYIAKKRHIPAFFRLKNLVSVSAVCDLNEELATDTARQFGIPHVYSDLGEMLSEMDLDIVDVCTPPKIHAPVALEAMESGKIGLKISQNRIFSMTASFEFKIKCNQSVIMILSHNSFEAVNHLHNSTMHVGSNRPS